MVSIPKMMVVGLDSERRVVFFNASAETADDFRREEILGVPWFDQILPPERLPDFRASLQAGREDAQARPAALELPLVFRGGEERHLAWRFVPFQGPEGVTTLAVGVDITQVQRNLSELAASREKFSMIFHQSPEAIDLTRTSDGVVLDCNEAFARLYGYTREEIVGRSLIPGELGVWTRQEDRDTYVEGLKRFGEVLGLEAWMRRKDGSTFIGLLSSSRLTIHGEECNLALTLDITKTRLAEQAFRRSEARFRMIAETMGEGLIVTDAADVLTYCNPRFLSLLGLREKEVLGRTFFELTMDSDLQECMRRMDERRQHQGGTYEIAFRHQNNQRVETLVSAQPLFDEQGAFSGTFGIIADITERKRVEEAVAVREREYRTLAENSPDNIIRYDRDCRILYANNQAKSSLMAPGDACLGKTPMELATRQELQGHATEIEHCQAVLSQVITRGEAADVELHLPDGTGDIRTHSIRIAPERDPQGKIVGALGFSRDITEQRRLEEQLRQSQKMEAIGKLAGGVAHDFNNLLTAIIGFGNLAKEDLGLEEPQQIFLDQILAAAERAATLTRGLLAFSRKQVLQPQPLDLNSTVKNIEALLRRLIGEDIDLTIRLSEVPLVTMADPGQMEQVLMNLATNARDAMPEGGRLIITTGLKVLERDSIGTDGFSRVGPYGVIAMSDSGAGMDEATRAKIFEPFFTTKEPGKGTGLGLSIAYGIVKQHEGVISVYSEKGAGTEFRVYLPLTEISGKEVNLTKESETRGGNETILVAEDDPNVRLLVGTVLRGAGYRVVEAIDGVEALDQFQAHAGDIDLAILDVIMPRKSGREVHDLLRTHDPRVKVLFTSGYTAEALDAKGVFSSDTQFLAKPMRPRDLLQKVRAILDGTD